MTIRVEVETHLVSYGVPSALADLFPAVARVIHYRFRRLQDKYPCFAPGPCPYSLLLPSPPTPSEQRELERFAMRLQSELVMPLSPRNAAGVLKLPVEVLLRLERAKLIPGSQVFSGNRHGRPYRYLGFARWGLLHFNNQYPLAVRSHGLMV